MSIQKERNRREFSDRLTEAVKFRGMRPYGRQTRLKEAFAERGITLSNASIGRWFSADNLPSSSNTKVLCEILAINVHWLMTGQGHMSSTLAITESGITSHIIAHNIPHLEADDVTDWMQEGLRTETMIPFFGELGRKAFVLSLPDQSLAPRFVKGTPFIVDPSRVLSAEKPVLALVMGCAIFGYPVKRPDAIMIEPENLNYAPTMANPGDVIGPVIGTAQRWLV